MRNYERNECLPPTDRTPTGYRMYTEVHAAALRAYVALVRGFGHASARAIMQAVHRGRIDDALVVIDAGHDQLLRDRSTLGTVRDAVEHIGTKSDELSVGASTSTGLRSIGELAHALALSPATVRTWERVGILSPRRDPATGYRVYDNDDVRDARLAHLLRRGGYLLDQIATVIGQIRSAGGTDELSKTVGDWQDKLTTQGLAMLTASRRLSDYLDVAPNDDDPETGEDDGQVAAVLSETVALFASAGWDAGFVTDCVEHVASRLGDLSSRSRAVEVLRRDHTVPVLLGLPPRSWTAMLRIVLGHPAPKHTGTPTGDGVLLRLLRGEPPDRLRDDADPAATDARCERTTPEPPTMKAIGKQTTSTAWFSPALSGTIAYTQTEEVELWTRQRW